MYRILVLALLVGCDADKDGLSSMLEKKLGTDPELADSDGDGIKDGVETDLGTDPTDFDSDDDGLSDGIEQDEGTDPTNADSDGDGANDGDEKNVLGSDPHDFDSDDDGLSDGEEQDVGTDPTNVDSDGDGYTDFDEVNEGSDPTDDTDLIYQGGWPYYANKDDIDDPGWSGKAKEGKVLPRFAWTDLYGDTVDIYDFAYDGKPIVIDISGLWCYWCHEIAEWLEGDECAYDAYSSYDIYKPISGYHEEGLFWWITVIDGSATGGAPTTSDLLIWYVDHPNESVPLLLDADQVIHDWTGSNGWPALFMLNEDMTIAWWDKDASYTGVWDELLLLGEE
ncbi:MAG: hypothetical protein HN348_09145 [Proteobacteria bacterium]|nr:hypothetical protein [Pseudomonadota bacterium]